jgi:hypothetical protein
LFFKVCTIGDSLYKFADKLYCVEQNKTISKNLLGCSTNQIRYFVPRNDSIAFSVFKFDDVIINCTENNLIKEIWLLKWYSSDSSRNNYDSIQTDFSFLRNFLNQNSGEKESGFNRSESTFDYSVEGFRWDLPAFSYVLKTTTWRKRKKDKYQRGSISVKIY